MSATNFCRGGTLNKTFHEWPSPYSEGRLRFFIISLSAVHILLSITAFLGNSLILVALHRESSLRPLSKLLYGCLATTDLLVGLVAQPLHAANLLSAVHEHWSLSRCLSLVAYITTYALCGVSLLTMTATSVDRVLVLLLGLRYRQILTLKRTYIIAATFWVLFLLPSLLTFCTYRSRTFLLGMIIGTPFCLIISLASYTKIFRTLCSQQDQVQDPVQQKPRQLSELNMMRLRKAVYSALWVQVALVVCYVPFYLVEIVITSCKTYSSHLIITRQIAAVLLYFNSTLNPFLYCWKIDEVRKTVKKTIRQALCCPWSFILE